MNYNLLRLAVVTGFIHVAGTINVMSSETGGPWRFGDIVVEQAWARIVPGGAGTGSVYLTIHNRSDQDDLLLAVDTSVADSTAVYSTTVKDEVVNMDPMPLGVNLPSHGEVVMRPGGIHIMMAGVSRDTKVGDLLPVKMVFRDAGSLNLEVPLVPLGAGDPAETHVKH